MCPNASFKQRGFLLPVAIFILVAMSAFALTLWRTTAQASISISQELISTQAYYAAESGAQLGAAKLLAGAGCATLAITHSFSPAGLNQCSVEVSCAGVSEFYQLTSIGQCGSGDDVSASRTIEVGVNGELDE